MQPTFIRPYWLFLCCFFWQNDGFFAQNSNNSPLDSYIQTGLANNLAIKTQEFDLSKSYLALTQAQALFMPQVSFLTQYTLAAGGRYTDLPVGDLLNNAYSTLNQLTRTQNFPQIQNQQISFLPNNYHDTRLHTVYPIFNREIVLNRDIRKSLIPIEQIKINTYKRELVKNIKIAYWQHTQATKAVEIYRNALTLVRENLRTNEKLVKNEVATQAVIYKAQSEVAKVENALTEAENNRVNAAAYFNFLLNRPLDAAIETDVTAEKRAVAVAAPLSREIENFVMRREEITQLNLAVQTNEIKRKLDDSYKIAKIGASLDLGFQGFGFELWNRQAYGLLGVQLEIPLYTAKGNAMKGQQTQLDIQKLQAQTAEVKSQIALQINVARTNLQTARVALIANEAELKSANEYYRLTERRWREGQALQIELIDARTQLTAAELKQNLSRYKILLADVELERAEGTYNF